MRGVHFLWTGILLVGFATGVARADEFRLASGNVLRGELASADEDGLVVKLDVGGFSKREPWVNFSQETLKEVAKLKKEYAAFVEPFIELAPEQLQAMEKAKEITVREVPTRLERPTEKTGLWASFFTPVGLMILGVLLLANLYAGYEIALFRQQPVALVCGLSLLLPLLGPLVFIALPARAPPGTEGEGEAEAAGIGSAGRKTTGLVPEKLAHGLSLAAADKRGSGTPQVQAQTFNRGEHTFNRRFFETKFAGFFRVVLGDAEKDMLLVFRTVKQEYVGRRISRISMSDLHLQLQSNNQEVPISFGEITSVQIRPKDVKA